MLPLIAALAFTAPQLPPLPPIRRDPQVSFLDRSGGLIGVRGGRYGPPVDVARLPAHVPAAFVAIEDRRFYEHAGFDPMGMARALAADLTQGRAAQGGSTITQQLARNLFLNNDRTLERKGQELLLAAQLERVYSKREILGLYLSRVYFGSGAYGLEAASRRYFNKSAAKLTVRESAMLAATMKSPTAYDPAEQPERSAERTALVLDAMVETGAISPGERARALAQTPKVSRAAPTAPAQYFIDWLVRHTPQLAGAPRQDLVVETTLDSAAETAADASARAAVARHARQGASQAALVALDGQGRVRAFVGGIDYASAPFDRAAEARRQAGSAWKPFVYLAAMEAGRTPDDAVVDEPLTIGAWSPQNYSGTYLGPITLETAFAQSINTVAARLANQVGTATVAAAARRAGIVSPINTDPAMALGTTQVSPLEMAQAYDAFANGGYRVGAYGVERIRTPAGAVVWRRGPVQLAPAIANPPLGEMDRLLRTVIASGTGVHAAIAGRDLAGKTGTTSDYKDAWFCGFTGNLVAVAWMGRDDAAPMGRITGGSAPAELWRGFMIDALRRLPSGPIPAGPPPPAPPPQAITPLPPLPPQGDEPLPS